MSAWHSSRCVVAKFTRMLRARTFAVLLACALANAALPTYKQADKESKMVQQEKTIAVRRVPIAYYYPFSLWPMPKYQVPRDPVDSHEIFHFKRSLTSFDKRKR